MLAAESSEGANSRSKFDAQQPEHLHCFRWPCIHYAQDQKTTQAEYQVPEAAR